MNNPSAFPMVAPDQYHPNGELIRQGFVEPGMTLRDYFAAQEDLSEYASPDCPPSNAMTEALAGPKPSHGWSCKTPEQYIAMLKWEAKWRSALRYIRADAMLAERERTNTK